MYHLRDFVTKKLLPTLIIWFLLVKLLLEVVMDLDSIKSKMNLDYFRSSPPSLLKYLPLLPITKQAEFITPTKLQLH